ncbi:hypothetical protein NW765_011454 [Fusarium oxysporum]|nr:hypothetical protein FOWG_10633 [Fusarium oxysporum f. sp. lycopersici MN25]KAJ4113847.1 hypothetical protein NW765_011454 [Fusarium oxysporum]KAJ4278827.1 hypothetical protein NW764_006185 [Fusarium oxysporum]
MSESEAMSYVLGYTGSNDISSRTSQFAQSQWCYSKGFDGACPIGPALASTAAVPDPSKFRVRGLKNGYVMQDCGVEAALDTTVDKVWRKRHDLQYSEACELSFSEHYLIPGNGTVIITGTPAGVGVGKSPKVSLRYGDLFKVDITPHIGTLISEMENE